MINNKTVLALIPARKGSKGIPGKNIKNFCGKPLIAWTIEQARQCSIIDRLIVSTDSDEIASIAHDFGAEAPFKRPFELANDSAKNIDVIIHALNWLRDRSDFYDVVVLLQPTSPLRRATDIEKAVELLFKKNADAIVSVCRVDHHPYWVNTLPDDGRMNNFIKPVLSQSSRQELPVFYRLNGAVQVVYSEYMLKYRSFFGEKTFSYIMQQENSVDIDSEIDFYFAEYLLKKSLYKDK